MQVDDIELVTRQVGTNAWNVKTTFHVPSNIMDEFVAYDTLKSRNKEVGDALKDFIRTVYCDYEIGYKIIASSFNSTYTKIRRLISKCVDTDSIRVGMDVITKNIKKLRSDRVQLDNPWKREESNKHRTSKGVAGNYTHNDTQYWLRSTYEYVYMKWLIDNNIKFEFEPMRFKLKNGETYLPDFFIYDEGGNITVIELKGIVFDKRIHKPQMLKEEYGYNVEIITDISKYTKIGYDKELVQWKKYLESTGQVVKRAGLKK